MNILYFSPSTFLTEYVINAYSFLPLYATTSACQEQPIVL